MDFVLSKVAMSICALLVLSILSGALGDRVLFDESSELASIAKDFSIAVERSAWSGCEETLIWDVPFVSNGDCVNMTIRTSAIQVRSGEKSIALTVACEIHTWAWNGSALNQTAIRALDNASAPLRTMSGNAIEIRTLTVRYESSERLFVFVKAHS